jgi:hypothetical protein
MVSSRRRSSPGVDARDARGFALDGEVSAGKSDRIAPMSRLDRRSAVGEGKRRGQRQQIAVCPTS